MELGETVLDEAIEGGPVFPELPEPAAAIRYRVMRGVPENWAPLPPVHVEGNNRETQLQRASLPRIIVGDPNPPREDQAPHRAVRTGLGNSLIASGCLHPGGAAGERWGLAAGVRAPHFDFAALYQSSSA